MDVVVGDKEDRTDVGVGDAQDEMGLYPFDQTPVHVLQEGLKVASYVFDAGGGAGDDVCRYEVEAASFRR